MADVDFQHLSTLLWREQELLDLLLFGDPSPARR